MKLRNARNLDARQSGLVDSAYFAVKAADKAVRRKQRPPLHEYIRHLIYTRLVGGWGWGWGWGAGLGAEGHRRLLRPRFLLRHHCCCCRRCCFFAPSQYASQCTRLMPPPSRLALGEVTKVMKKLRRLPWAESEPYLLKTLLRASHKGRFSQIPHIASLAAGLARYHPSLGVGLMDDVLEEVALGLESPDAGGWLGA